MYHIKNDQRAIRSGQMLYDALVVLMGQKKFEQIKVSDLVKQAQLGRATFYRNFDAIEDVLRMRCDQTVDGLMTYIMSYRETHKIEHGRQLLKPLLRYFYLHSSIIELLMQAERLDIMQTAFQKRLEPFKQQLVGSLDVPEEYIEYGIVIRTSVAMNIVIHWIKNGKRHAPDELADTLEKLMKKMVTLDQLL